MSTSEHATQHLPSDINHPEKLYSQLAHLLSSSSITELEVVDFPILELEAHNPHHPFVCFSDHQLAIPQKVLYIVYGHACKQFRKVYEPLANLLRTPDLIELPHSNLHIESNVSTELFKLTHILLIQNPDHLTALSCRRNLIKFQINYHGGDGDRHSQKTRLISKELDLSKLILGIPSHSKSAGLWFHRRWCFHQMFPADDINSDKQSSHHLFSSKHSVSSNLPPEILNHELEFNLKCCDRYPRNYYAWSHRQWLIDQLINSTRTSTYPEVLVEQTRMLKFLSVHPRDHSCLHYIHSLILNLITLKQNITTTTTATEQESGSIQLSQSNHEDQTLKFLQDLFVIIKDQTEYEPIWSFLKFISSLQQRPKENFNLDHIELDLKFVRPMLNQTKDWLTLVQKPLNKSDGGGVNSSGSNAHDSKRGGMVINTLADRTHQNLIRSLQLAIRALYFLNFSHFHSFLISSSKFDHQQAKFVLESTKLGSTSLDPFLLSSLCLHSEQTSFSSSSCQ